MKYAVISNPRTGSRSLANKFSKEFNTKIGYVHFAQSVQSSCLTYEELEAQDWILHGHWHTIHRLSPDHKDYIKENYKIFNIKRNHMHRFVSAVIVMQTGNFAFSRNQIPKIIDKDYVYEYVKRMRPAFENSLKWNYTNFDFDKLYNDTSATNFQLNIDRIENYEEISELYERLIEKDKPLWDF